MPPLPDDPPPPPARATGPFRFSSRLQRRIVRKAGRVVGDYGLIDEGDHVLVAVSGGKDSLTLLEVLCVLARRSPVRFRLSAATVDTGLSDVALAALRDQVAAFGVPHHVVPVPMAEILADKLGPHRSPCSLCSRIRRGALYTLAPELGCRSIALGHHLDDLIETLLMNLFYSGQLRAMAPVRTSDDGRNRIIRPLCTVPEAWIARHVMERRLPTVTCGAAFCGGADETRQRTKALVARLAGEIHGLHGNVLRAMKNLCTDQLLDPAYLRDLPRVTGATADPAADPRRRTP